MKEKAEAEARDKEIEEKMNGVKKPNIYSRKMSRIVEAKMSGANNSKKSLASVIREVISFTRGWVGILIVVIH